MDIYEALYTARAMRRLKPDPIPYDVQARILDAAIRAPKGSAPSGPASCRLTSRMRCVPSSVFRRTQAGSCRGSFRWTTHSVSGGSLRVNQSTEKINDNS